MSGYVWHGHAYACVVLFTLVCGLVSRPLVRSSLLPTRVPARQLPDHGRPDRGSLLRMARGWLPTEGSGRGARVGWVVCGSERACSLLMRVVFSWASCCGASRASSTTRWSIRRPAAGGAVHLANPWMPGGGGSRYVSGHPGTVTRRRFATYSLLLRHHRTRNATTFVSRNHAAPRPTQYAWAMARRATKVRHDE